MDDNCYYKPDQLTDSKEYKIFNVSVMEEVFEQSEMTRNIEISLSIIRIHIKNLRSN